MRATIAGLLALPCAAMLLALAVPPPTLEAEVTSNDGTYRVRYRVDPELVEFGERFSVELWPARSDGADFASTLTVDARMPQHGHGMNREPIVEDLEGGGFRVTNLYFHMPGYWEVYFDLTRGAVTERAQFSLDIE